MDEYPHWNLYVGVCGSGSLSSSKADVLSVHSPLQSTEPGIPAADSWITLWRWTRAYALSAMMSNSKGSVAAYTSATRQQIPNATRVLAGIFKWCGEFEYFTEQALKATNEVKG